MYKDVFGSTVYNRKYWQQGNAATCLWSPATQETEVEESWIEDSLSKTKTQKGLRHGSSGRTQATKCKALSSINSTMQINSDGHDAEGDARKERGEKRGEQRNKTAIHETTYLTLDVEKHCCVILRIQENRCIKTVVGMINTNVKYGCLY
jgi:hypothetical protein